MWETRRIENQTLVGMIYFEILSRIISLLAPNLALVTSNYFGNLSAGGDGDYDLLGRGRVTAGWGTVSPSLHSDTHDFISNLYSHVTF